MTDKNPMRVVRQSAKRASIPVVLEVDELHRLFDGLKLRERAMVVVDALTGIRRSELMGLRWEDVDFIGSKINGKRHSKHIYTRRVISVAVEG